ncbi:MAG: leucine-rich repeat domain-containing protein [Muribaculaceae bacterium]|nr:leucine-rich repeat domain-containing protein [Muribaculaceae bacterium]
MKNLYISMCLLLCVFTAKSYDMEANGIYYNLTDNETELSVADADGNFEAYKGDLVIPEEVTYNGKNYKVTSIEDEAFEYCFHLISVEIPGSVTTIGNSAFSSCSSLTSVSLADGLTSIGASAFNDCSSLASVLIPETVTNIGYGAFRGCYALKTATLSENITSIESYAFCECSSLDSVTIPGNVISIGNDAFYGCTSLSSVIVPENVNIIGEWTFAGCTSLTSVTLPGSLNSIGLASFRGCSSLSSISCYALTPPELGDNVFEGLDTAECNLNVPKESVEQYSQAAQWSDFKNIHPVNPDSGVSSVNVSENDVTVYDLNGKYIGSSVRGLPQGIYIIQDGIKTTKEYIR